MNDLVVTVVQTDLTWEDPDANRNHLSIHLGQIRQSDLIILPEMFTTGFSMSPEKIAETYHPETMETLAWMKANAKKLNSVICGSVAVRSGNKFYNRLMWVRQDGTHTTYDKRHLFRMAGEHQHYAQGEKLIVEEISGWKICPLICYDLRFPVWSRNRMVEGSPLYDLLIYIANWPEVRRNPWRKLLPARAIENQCYVAGVNRVGKDGLQLDHAGDSVVIDPRGETLLEFDIKKEGVKSVSLSWNELAEFREKFPVLSDGDEFSVQP